MKISLAKIISFIFHPMTAVFFAPFLLLYRTSHSLQTALYWSVYTLFYILFLMLFMLFAVRKKIFSDLDVSRRDQRPLLYQIGSFIGIIYIISLFFLKAPFILYFAALGIVFGVIVFSIINRRIKASIHVAAVVALIFPVCISYGNYYFLLLFLIPLIVWARLKTKRHTLSEILVGGTVGGLLSLSFYYVAKFFLNK